MIHENWRNMLRAVFFAGVLTASPAILRAQSTQPAIVPIFSLSANGLTSAQAYQGWALLFDAELCHPNLYSTSTNVATLPINPQNGTWANAIQLVVMDSTGATQNWPIQLASTASGSLSLDATNVGRLAWVVAPSDTAAIGAGVYRVVGILNTTTSAGTTGWNGIRQSNPVSIQVSAPPGSPSASQQVQQAELLANYHVLVGNISQALADVNNLLTQQPNAVGVLALEGNLLEQMGDTAGALAAYDQAVAAFYAANPGILPEPPDGLTIHQGSLRSKLLSQSGVRGQPQVAIQLLDQGMQSPGVFFVDLKITNVGNDVAEHVVLNQIALQTLAGTGQVIYNNVLSPQLPSFTDFLRVNASATVRIFVTAQGTVNGFSMTENGAAADIFGTPSSFSQTQTVSVNFTGNLGPLTITANNATQQYGQPTPFLNNATYNGFVNGDTPASLGGTLNCATTATQSSPVGTYPITCSGQTSAAYTITYVPGTLTVTPAPLTVTAKNVSSPYGQAAVLNGASYSGFANGDTAASLSGTLNCTTTATSVSPVGTYPINCSGLTSTNYTISFVQGALTITPVPLTIAANNESRAYGVANPLLNSVTASGFVNGDTLLSLGGTLICTTPATPASPAGAYTITCSGLTSPNYSITYLPGTLSITGDALTITVSTATRQYGQENPSLNNVTYIGFVNGDTPTLLSGTLSCVTSATPTSPVGTYGITCSGLTSANYSINFIPGTLTIAPAPLTIAASTASRPYGANNPVLGGVVSGLQNADPITATFTTTAVPASPIGAYPITPVVSDPSNRLRNYTPSLVNGTLSVVQETTTLAVAVLPTSIPVGQSATVTVTLTAPDMVIPIPNDPTVLAPITVTSPSFPSDILSNNGVCTPVPSSIPGVASCTITVTSVEPNGRTLNASFAGSADMVASSSTANLIVTAALQGQQSCIRSDFRNVPVPGGNYLWFNSIFKMRDVSKQLVHISFLKSTAQFQYTDPSGNAVNVNQGLPDARITIDPNATAASTSFDAINNVWITTIPWDLDDNIFLTGMPWSVPTAGLPPDVEPVMMCGTFASDVAGVDIGWRWAAAAYSSFSGDNTVLGVKPMNTDHDNPPANRHNAGTPENFKSSVIPGARGKGGKNYTGSYSGSAEIE